MFFILLPRPPVNLALEDKSLYLPLHPFDRDDCGRIAPYSPPTEPLFILLNIHRRYVRRSWSHRPPHITLPFQYVKRVAFAPFSPEIQFLMSCFCTPFDRSRLRWNMGLPRIGLGRREGIVIKWRQQQRIAENRMDCGQNEFFLPVFLILWSTLGRILPVGFFFFLPNISTGRIPISFRSTRLNFPVARSLPALIACNGESMCWPVNETETISFPLKKSLKRFYIQLQKFRFHVTAVGASACVVICVKSCLHTLY